MERYMKNTKLGILLLCSMASLVSFESLAAGKNKGLCHKTCLTDVTEQYVEAMVRGTIDGVPLAPRVRATSNSELVKPGKGETWQEGITLVNRYTFLDPATGTSIFYGTIAAKPEPGQKRTWWHYGVRLMVNAKGKISEIEEMSNHLGLKSAQKLEIPFKEAAIYDSVLPEDERVSSAELIRAADSYFSGLTSGEGKKVLFGPDCQRTEFGTYTTNNFKTVDGEETVLDKELDKQFIAEDFVGPSCRSVFDVDEKFHWPIANRRFYITDEARGVVVAVVQFNKLDKEGSLPGLSLIEAFKVVNGRIDFIWAPTFTFGSKETGWPDWQRP